MGKLQNGEKLGISEENRLLPLDHCWTQALKGLRW